MRYICVGAISLLVTAALVQCHVMPDSSLRHQKEKDQGVYLHGRSLQPWQLPVEDVVVDNDILRGSNDGRYRRSLNTSMTAGYDWNEVVDVIVSIAQRDILAQGKDSIVLQDAYRVFDIDWGFAQIKARFSAREGTLGNLTAFQRSGDVSVVKRGEVHEITCVLRLDDLRMRYKRYDFEVVGVSQRGSLEGTMFSNKVAMTLNFASTGEGCTSTLRGVNMTDLKRLKVTLTGEREISGFAPTVSKWMEELREGEIVSIVDRLLQSEIKKALQEFNCDEYASLLLVHW